MMKLNLRDLHIDILKHNRTYDVFDYSHNEYNLVSCLNVDCIPFKLILVKKRSNTISYFGCYGRLSNKHIFRREITIIKRYVGIEKWEN